MRISTIIFLFSVSLPCMAAETHSGKHIAAGIKQVQFIRKLYDEKRHFECIAETHRYLFHNPELEENKKNALMFFIAANYYLGAQYSSAAKIAAEKLPPDYPAGRILLSQALKKSGHSNQSFRALEGLEFPAGDPFLRYELLIRKADALIAIGKYNEALREIESQEKFFSSEKLRNFSSALSSIPKNPPCDEGRAMLYSALFPGAGQAYAGKYFDGFLSFVAVFLSGFGTWYYHKQGNVSIRNFFSVFTGIFYLGNIYGSYNSASAANRFASKKYYDEIVDRFIPSYDPLRFTEIPEIVP